MIARFQQSDPTTPWAGLLELRVTALQPANGKVAGHRAR